MNIFKREQQELYGKYNLMNPKKLYNCRNDWKKKSSSSC